MPLELQRSVLSLVEAVYGGSSVETPDWLRRPGRAACGEKWHLVQPIYLRLTGLELPDETPPRETRRVDAVLQRVGEAPRIIEVDEKQHFNQYRALTLLQYPKRLTLAFDLDVWLQHCQQKRRLEGGGFARPRPPLFPGQDGRHKQRAFRDALADLLPSEHGFLPTLRIAHFEVEDWIAEVGAALAMGRLLTEKGVRVAGG